jgi:puromycin-sensitive aminopeptidase
LSTALALPTPVLLENARHELTLGGCAPVLANVGGQGYYRTAYSAEALARVGALAVQVLTPAERIRLVGDEWALVTAGVHDSVSFLRLAASLAGDPEPEVLAQVVVSLGFLHDILIPATDQPRFEAWVRAVFGPRVSALGWERAAGDTEDQARARELLLALLATSGRDPQALSRVRSLAREAASAAAGGNRVPTGLPVLRAAAATADSELVAMMAEAMAKSPSPDAQSTLREALAAVADPAHVTLVMDLALGDRMRAQESLDIVTTLLANPAAAASAWGSITTRWSDLTHKLGGMAASTSLVAATGSLCSEDARSGVEKFFTGRIDQPSRTLRVALEQISACRMMKAREATALPAWLASATR